MVAPGYFASAAALTLAAVVPVSAVSPLWPLLLVVEELEVPVAASALPVAATTAPPPKPASSRALAARSFRVLPMVRGSFIVFSNVVRRDGQYGANLRPGDF